MELSLYSQLAGDGAFSLEQLDSYAAHLLDANDVRSCEAAIKHALVPAFAAAVRLYVPAIGDLGLESGCTVVPLETDSGVVGALRLEGVDSSAAESAFITRVAKCAALALRQILKRTSEQQAARAFQHAALDVVLPEIPGFRFDTFYEPGQSEALVGGDWYDAFQLPDGRIVVAIGDVMGTGVNAAVQMMNVRQTMRGVAYVEPDPAIMLDAAAQALLAQYRNSFVTAFVALFDPVTGVLTYANAGHPPALIRSRDGLVAHLGATRLPLGIETAAAHRVAHTALDPGSVLVLYTDGLIERNRDIVCGLEQLAAVVSDTDLPIGAQVVANRTLKQGARDDVAILTMAYDAEVKLKRWRFDPKWADAARRVKEEVFACFDSMMEINAERQFALRVILAEIFGNLIRHAPGTAEVILELNDQQPMLHVLDKGPGFHFLPRLPTDLFAESGRGLFLISKLAKSFSLEPRPGGGSHARILIS